MSSHSLALISKRFFPRSKQVIFILGIIIISVIAGFFGSFFTSMTQRNYFVNANENNIITILESGYKTPVVSYIPADYVNVLKDIKGITAISPEVHSLVLIKNQPVTLHGITSTFFEMDSNTVTAGKPLSYIITSNRNDILIAGYSIAKILGLKVGSSYTLYSSNTNSYFTFYLAGIVKFNNFNDEDLFANVNVTSFLRSQSSILYYSMIRIKIDTSIVSKTQINDLLSQRFLLNVNLVSHIQNANIVHNKTIQIFQTNGVFMGSNKTNSNGSCTFLLPVGYYVLYYTAFNIVYNQSFIVVGPKVENIYADPFNSIISADNSSQGYNLSITSFYEGQTVSSKSLILTPPNSPRNFFYNMSNLSFANLPGGNYTIQASYGNFSVKQSFLLDNNLNVDVNFSHRISFIVKNNLNNTISGFGCTLLNYQTNKVSTYSTCPSYIDLDNSIYNVTINTSSYGSRSFILPVNENLTSSDIITYVGSGTQVFTIQNQTGQPLNNTEMFVRETGSSKFTFIGSTTADGKISFQYEFGKEYYLLFSNGTTNATISFNPTSLGSTDLVYQPFHDVNFTATFLYNDGSNYVIKNNPTILTTVDGANYNLLTGNNGMASQTLHGDFVGKISISYGTLTKSFQVDSLKQTNYEFILGSINLHLSIASTGYQIIPNASVVITSTNFNKTFINSNGILDLFLPSNTISNDFSNGPLPLTAYNYSSFKNNYFQNYLYTVTVSTKQSQYTFFLSKTYQSSNNYESVKLQYAFGIKFTIQDVIGKYVPSARIVLTNDRSTFTAITDLYGRATIIANSGNYSLVIQFINYEFDYSLSVNQNQTLSLKIPIFIGKITLQPIWKPNFSALSGKQYLDEFYSSSVTYFLEIFIVLLFVAVFILVLLFSSVVKLTIESIENEIFILNLLGTSKRELFLNLLYNFQMRSIISSGIGLVIGMYLTQFLNSFNSVQVLGFIFYSQFNIFYFVLFLVAINAIIFIVLVFLLRKMKVIYPIEFLKRM